MVDRNREVDKRTKDKEREIEALRIKTSNEKGTGHTEFRGESPTMGEQRGAGQERREERRDARQENRQDNRLENRQERREERRDNR